MSFNPSTIAIVLLSLAACVLLFVTQCQRKKLVEQDAAIEASKLREQNLQEQLAVSQATLEADRKRIIDIVMRVDRALTTYVDGSSAAHDSHEKRLDELAHPETKESEDWLCAAVPNDVRRMFGIAEESCDSPRADENQPTSSSSDSVREAVGDRVEDKS